MSLIVLKADEDEAEVEFGVWKQRQHSRRLGRHVEDAEVHRCELLYVEPFFLSTTTLASAMRRCYFHLAHRWYSVFSWSVFVEYLVAYPRLVSIPDSAKRSAWFRSNVLRRSSFLEPFRAIWRLPKLKMLRLGTSSPSIHPLWRRLRGAVWFF